MSRGKPLQQLCRGVVIFADIEGSSGCFDRAGSQWLTQHWLNACLDMTLDVKAVVEALAAVGMRQVTIADFHRTGFNLFRELLPAWVKVRQGYRAGPIPGLGSVPPADRAFFIGMHAAGGTKGFLAHTLTSQFAELTLNGRPLAEIELFAGSLGNAGIRPALFSGCPVACEQAEERIPGMVLCPVPPRPMTDSAKTLWRTILAESATAACRATTSLPPPHLPAGPFLVRYRKVGISGTGAFSPPDFAGLYQRLLELAYFPRLPAGWLPLALRLHNLTGRMGLLVHRCLSAR